MLFKRSTAILKYGNINRIIRTKIEGFDVVTINFWNILLTLGTFGLTFGRIFIKRLCKSCWNKHFNLLQRYTIIIFWYGNRRSRQKVKYGELVEYKLNIQDKLDKLPLMCLMKSRNSTRAVSALNTIYQLPIIPIIYCYVKFKVLSIYR